MDGLDLEIAEGEQLVLLGPSGSGKTTLLRALLGAVPVSGAVRVGGRDPHGPEAREIRRATGFVRQGNDLVLGVSARLNAVMGTSPTWSLWDWATVLRGRIPRRFADRLTELARDHGIADCLAAPARELSGGQRQRVGLVRALLPRPRLILADEPTTGLDPVTAKAAVDALRAVPGVTLVFTTHDLDVARRFPRVIALREGRLVHDGPGVDAEVYS